MGLKQIDAAKPVTQPPTLAEHERRAWLAALVSGDELIRRGAKRRDVKRLLNNATAYLGGGSHHNPKFCLFDPNRADVLALLDNRDLLHGAGAAAGKRVK